MNRRTWMTGLLGVAAVAEAAEKQTGVIDAHIHLFDPTRPQGVPWPGKEDAVLYKPALPERYRALAESEGVVGAVVVEASPWPADNWWLLEQAAKAPMILGIVGNLGIGATGFEKELGRLALQPAFKGLRYGNLWDRDVRAAFGRPAFREGLRLVEQAGLTLDTANPDRQLLEWVLKVTDAAPNLRVVIDHLPQMAEFPAEGDLIWRELAGRKNVWVKVSEVLRRVDRKVPLDVAFYRDRLDRLWSVFGEDRLVFGSDWPNGDNWGSYEQVIGLMRNYLAGKPAQVREKYFSQNARAAYRLGEIA